MRGAEEAGGVTGAEFHSAGDAVVVLVGGSFGDWECMMAVGFH